MAQGQINDQEERECEESLLSPDRQRMSVSDCATQPDSENGCSVTISSPRNSAPAHDSSPEVEFFVIPKDLFTGLTESLWAFEKCSANLTSSVPLLPAPPNDLPNVPAEVLPSPLLPHHHLHSLSQPLVSRMVVPASKMPCEVAMQYIDGDPMTMKQVYILIYEDGSKARGLKPPTENVWRRAEIPLADIDRKAK
ncbi:hypothetical protein BU17DRAFT_90226 [Hysterangium stoloniferum]|nr:hypothetical protein BU17DRAFT_90226 [Hysterangium stoloniferum]